MKNILLVVCLLISISTSAAKINFLDNPKWESVLEKAEKENKLIFLDAYATWCEPCKSMNELTYKDFEVVKYYNANYINVKYDMEKGEGKMLAEKYQVTSYPSLIFLNKKGNILHKGIGFYKYDAFITLGKQAKNPATQYYTVKKKALALNSSNFLQFAIMASQTQDIEFFDISNNYIAKQSDIFFDFNLIDLIMNYAYKLPDEKTLAYFARSKDKIIRTGKYTSEQFENRLAILTLRYSISKNVQPTQEINFDTVKSLIDKYIPQNPFFIYHTFRVNYFLENSKIDNAVAEFNILLSNTDKFNFEYLYEAMLDLAPHFNKHAKLDEILKKFEEIKIPEKDKELAYSQKMARAMIYHRLNDFDKFKVAADNFLKEKDIPEDIKNIIGAYLTMWGQENKN